MWVSANALAVPTTDGTAIVVPNDGWYQIQRADNFQSVCEGQQRCEVTSGDYIVINHTSGERHSISVDGPTTATDPVSSVSVSGNLIQWPDDGWYQVQDATTFATLCEGGLSCTVANGNYHVINHTTGERENNITVTGDSAVDSPVVTPPVFDLVAPMPMPAGCIGSIDSLNTRFCVDPDTRVFSATNEDGALWWSFTLPGTTETNQIEAVLTTEQWLIVVADRYPERNTFTINERENQYEASLFNKSGSFVRTVPLTIDLVQGDSREFNVVNSRYSAGLLNDPLNAIATESDTGSPLLVIGWNSFRNGEYQGRQWETGGVTVFDLALGNRLRNLYFSQNGITHISLLKGDRDIVRVVSEQAISWYYIDSLRSVHSTYFSQFAQDALIKPYGGAYSSSQINGSNYRDIISRVLPWINGDIANDLLFGSVSDEPPRNLSIPYNEFTVLSQFDQGEYSNDNYQCFNSGEVLNRSHNYVQIQMNVFDHCEFAGKTYDGKLSGNYVGRDGYGVRGENLTVYRNDSSVTTGTIDHSVLYSRVLGGSSRSYFGSMAGYGQSTQGKNVSVANYVSSADFYYGPAIGTDICAREYSAGGQPITTLFCDRHRADGHITGTLSLSADWTSYGSIYVNTNLSFGREYYDNFGWSSTDGSSLPNPVPFDGPTEPLNDFYFNASGSIIIQAQDQSRIELSTISQVGEPAFDVTLYDENGNNVGNFPMEFLDVKCAERLGTCTTP